MKENGLTETVSFNKLIKAWINVYYMEQIISVKKLRMTFTDNSYLPDILREREREGEKHICLIFMKGESIMCK